MIMSIALHTFVDDIDPMRERMILLFIDQAGFHVAEQLRVPDNVVLRFLPSHTPELQPVESAWPILREATHNRTFSDLAAMENVIVRRCCFLMDHPEIVHGRTGFAWACAMA